MRETDGGAHESVRPDVHRLIAENTIEEKVVALAQRRAELFTGVMDEGDLFASSLSAEDMRGLFEQLSHVGVVPNFGFQVWSIVA